MAVTALVVFTLLLIAGMACNGEVPKKTLNDGREMPAIALGTWLGIDKNGAVQATVEFPDLIAKAVDVGWRHFDSATIYNTEKGIGEGLRRQIDNGTIKREDVYVTTKVWNTHHRRKQVAESLRKTLADMGFSYIDMYLMHWPIGVNEDNSESDVDFMETWRGMEDVHRLGLTRSIGLSNFNKEQVARVIREGTVKPAALQIEVHPQMVNADLVEYAQSQGIVVMGFSPFGSMVTRYAMTFPGPKFTDPLFVRLAQKYNKTPAQIVLRWSIDRGVVPLPKSVSVKRLQENINVFDFLLQKDEIDEINALNSNTRYTLPSFWQNHSYYPFEKIDNPVPNPFVKPQ